ncbi:hypothetical protein CQZ88_07615 [Rhodococcus sp. ENV425]|nr:hypothetical protein CQZ88_07615 [Rhodococcus sp. ENV425]
MGSSRRQAASWSHSISARSKASRIGSSAPRVREDEVVDQLQRQPDQPVPVSDHHPRGCEQSHPADGTGGAAGVR